ncbi:CinA family protein [Polycyclovorans algicola]|uniref:CinA family protein n=1 Tax=Polycyclovorans algicola TaxID=616992 RepID=UPI0004A6D309|nr:CinA family protein [Polycyclovorans algicola]
MNHQSLIELGHRLQQRSQWLAVAESCTGGLIAAQITDIPGASGWFDRGVVSYSNRAKTELLGVPEALIAAHGAVSGEVARAMAAGLRQRAGVHWTVAVTGVAGPGGGTPDKPVGTVWIAWAGPDGSVDAAHCLFNGDRASVRLQTVERALHGLVRQVGVG